MEFSLPELTPGQYEFGVVDLLLFSNDIFDKYQVGFSIDGDGNPLFGFDEGDWQEGWYVIGINQNCFDPVFVDLNDPDLPIYNAMIGMGSWEENLICESYQSFLCALQLVKDLKGRYSDSESVPAEEAQRFMVNIQEIVGDGDLYYWGMYIQLEERDIEFNKVLQRASH